jgi:hypothetical protein
MAKIARKISEFDLIAVIPEGYCAAGLDST